LVSILSGLVIFLGALGYISFEKTDALEAIRETDE
jgi:hypothetical protein